MRNGKARGPGRVRVDDAPHVIPLFIAAQMHFDLAGRAQPFGRLQYIAPCVDADELFRCDEALAHARGRRQKRSVLQFRAHVAVVGRYPAKLPHLVADIANLLLDRPNIHNGTPFHVL